MPRARFPLRRQPRDRRRQPSRVLAEQPLQGRAEVARRQPTQVQDRQHLRDLRRAAHVRRQDPRAEPLPLAGLLSTRRSFTRGAWTWIVPDPTVNLRSRARPLLTTSGMPVLVALVGMALEYSSTSASSAATSIRRAPSRASSSSVTRIPSSSSPTGSLRTSTTACLPFPPHGGRSSQPGRYAAFLFTRIHNFWV